MIEETNDDNDNVCGKPINIDFLQPVGQQEGATGAMYEYEGDLYAQYCHYGEVYYQSCEIYGNNPTETEKAIDRIAHSSKLWSLCDNSPSFQDNPMLHSELE